MRKYSKHRYQPYKAKKFKIPFYITIIIVAAIVIFVATVIVGNVLKKRLENTVVDTTPIETIAFDTTSGEAETIPKQHDNAISKVSSGFATLTGEEKDVRNSVDSISSKYNCLTIVAINSENRITYQSPAVIESSGLDASTELIPFDNIKAAVDEAKDCGMRVSVVMNYTSSSAKLVARELTDLKIDEIILNYSDVAELDENNTSSIISVVQSITENYSVNVGVAFSTDIYTAVRNTPLIEKVFEVSDFLSIDFTSISSSDVSSMMEDISGCFTSYLLRPLLDGSDSKTVGEIDSFLTENNILAREYISTATKTTDTTKK